MNIKFIVYLIFGINIVPVFFAQKHDIIIERAEKLHIDTKYGNFNVTVSKINRQQSAITVFIDIYKDVYRIADMYLQLYALYSNEYRLMPARISESVCKFMDNEWQWVANEAAKTGNIPRKCPFPPGLYFVKNFVLDSRKIPDMPWDKMMIWGNITLGKEKLLVASIKIYVRYDRDGMFLRKQGID